MTALVVISAEYNGVPYQFTDAGWFNATEAAKRHGKRPAEWMRLPETKRYLKALARSSKVGKSHFMSASRGRYGATWFHPKLAVRFAQWLDIDFAIWCDERIEQLIHGRLATSLYAQRLALEAQDATSKQKGTIGSRLMNERKREIPSIATARKTLEAVMQPSLLTAA